MVGVIINVPKETWIVSGRCKKVFSFFKFSPMMDTSCCRWMMEMERQFSSRCCEHQYSMCTIVVSCPSFFAVAYGGSEVFKMHHFHNVIVFHSFTEFVSPLRFTVGLSNSIVFLTSSDLISSQMIRASWLSGMHPSSTPSTSRCPGFMAPIALVSVAQADSEVHDNCYETVHRMEVMHSSDVFMVTEKS